MILDLTLTKTPVGSMALYGAGDELLTLRLDGAVGADTPHERFLTRHLGAFTTRRTDDAAGAAARLRRYFAGELEALDEQPLRILGTDFQRATWEQLRTVRPGRTLSYAGLAQLVGRPNAVRAVAAANGTLWGYGGGLPMKQWLLRHEGAQFTPLPEQESLPL